MATAPPRASGPTFTTAALLDLDPELAVGLDEGARAKVARRAIVPTVALPPGAWEPSATPEGAAEPLGLLVVDGLIVRDVTVANVTTSELLGPGDVAGVVATAESLFPAPTAWRVVAPARVAAIDATLLAALGPWPAVTTRLLARAARQHARLAVARAISHLPHVELRLLALLWHLAERWGRIGSDGVVVPLQLTHEALGRMVGARRPTVSLAMKALAADGTVLRRPDATWVLSHAGAERLRQAA